MEVLVAGAHQWCPGKLALELNKPKFNLLSAQIGFLISEDGERTISEG